MSDSLTAAQYRDQLARAMTEAELQANVEELAKAHGWLYYHTYDSRRSQAGFPDLVLIRGDVVLVRELKKAKGVVSWAQQAWLDGFTFAGVDARVWRPADWFEGRILRELGGGGGHG